MSDPVDLSVERAARESDNRNISVEQALRWALGDALNPKEGKVPFRALVIIEYLGEANRSQNLSYRANLTRLEELGLVDLHKAELIERWKET